MRLFNGFIIVFLYFVSVFPAAGVPAVDTSDHDAIRLYEQIDISKKVAEYLDGIFSDFSDGYIEANDAMAKISVLKNEYINSTDSLSVKGLKLDRLVRKLFSQIENYFIYFKRAGRENISINYKIAELMVEIARETVYLQHFI